MAVKGVRAAVVVLLAALFLLPLAGIAAAQSVPWDRPTDELLVDTGTAVVGDGQPDERCEGVVGVPAQIGCQTSGGSIASGLVGSIASGVTGSVFESLTQAVSQGAIWFLSKVASLLDTSTSPDLQASWYQDQYQLMIALSAIVILPLVLVSIIDAALHARPGDIVKALFVYLPIAGIVSYVTLELADMALEITDWASAYVSGDVAADASLFLERVGAVLSNSTAGPELPMFAVLIGSLFVVFASFLLWIELVLRTAGVNLAVLFLPLSFATMVWPRIAKWASRVLRLLAALILCKFFIIAVISLGASMLTAVSGQGGLEAVIAGSALLALATMAPWVVWRLLAPVESAVDFAMDARSRIGARAAAPAGAGTGVRGVAPALAGTGMASGLPVVGGGAHPAALSAERATGGATAMAATSAARSGAEAVRRQSGAVAAATGGGGGGGGGGTTTPPPGGGGGGGGTSHGGGRGGGYGPPVVTEQPYGPPSPAPPQPVVASSRPGAMRGSGPPPTVRG